MPLKPVVKVLQKVSIVYFRYDCWLFGLNANRSDALAAAMTAGLAAYFLKLAQLGKLHHDDGTAVDVTPQAIKDFIVSKAWSRYGTPRPGIFNAIDPGQDYCPWNPSSTQPLRRQDDDAQCLVPTSQTPSSTPTPGLKPMVKQGPFCHKEGDYPDHGNVEKSAAVLNAGAACSIWTGNPNGKHLRYRQWLSSL